MEQNGEMAAIAALRFVCRTQEELAAELAELKDAQANTDEPNSLEQQITAVEQALEQAQRAEDELRAMQVTFEEDAGLLPNDE